MELRRKSLNSLLGRILSGIALCSLLAFSLLPIPLLLPEPDDRFGYGIEKDLSVPFPCMHRRCGCKSAAQCSKQCCCFSAAQKAEWAQQQDASPRTVKTKPRLRTSLNPELCGAFEQAPAALTQPDRKNPVENRSPLQIDWVSGPQFSVCHGQSSLWLCVPVAIVPDCAQLSDGSALPADARPIFSEALCSAEPTVPTPPPKLG